MFSRLLRRLQKYTLPLKLIALTLSLSLAGYAIFSVPPTTPAIALVATLLALIFLLTLSLFLPLKIAFLLATTLAFLLFLKAVDLLTLLNLGLFAVFLILLGLYLRKK